MNIKFSVILPIYWKNEFSDFKKTFKSIVCQSLRPNEIIIIFDGKVNSEIKKFINKSKKKYKIKILKNTKNLGLGKSLNKCIKFCKNEIIARVDCDDINYPNRFKNQIRTLLKNNLDLVGSSTLEYNSGSKTKLIKSNPIKNDRIKKYLKFKNSINHQTVIFKKKSVLRSGNYEHVPFFEDYFLWVKMAKNNFKFGNINKILVKAKIDGDFYHRRSGKKYFLNYYYFLKKCLKVKYINRIEFFILLFFRGLIYSFSEKIIKFFYISFLRKKF